MTSRKPSTKARTAAVRNRGGTAASASKRENWTENEIEDSISDQPQSVLEIREQPALKSEKKVVRVDYMTHASQKTKQRRATSTARKEQIGLDEQIQLSQDMRAMVNAENTQQPQQQQQEKGDEKRAKQSVPVNVSLLPFIIEDSSSAQSCSDATDTESRVSGKKRARGASRGEGEEGVEHDEKDEDSSLDGNPASYLRKKFADEARLRREKRNCILATKPKFLSARSVRAASPEPILVDDDAAAPPGETDGTVTTTQRESEVQGNRTLLQAIQPFTGGAGVGVGGGEGGGGGQRSLAAGECLVRMTGSDQIRPRDYSTYADNRFKDKSFDADRLAEQHLVQQLIATLATRENLTAEQAEELFMARGYGKRALTMESFNLCSHTYGKSCYPTSTPVRCRYDHHPFTGVPVLIPIKYYEKSNTLTVFPNICFCSFSCALAYLEREAPSTMRRSDRVQMLHFMARKFFGVSDHIRPAPFLEQHQDYGGRLTTEQWRALSSTHCSFIQYPIAVSVPCTIITEITIQQKLDRNVMASIAKRTDEEHAKALPDKPEFGEDDAQTAYKRDQKEGKGRPLKRRTLNDDSGRMVTLDKAFLDERIRKARDDNGLQSASNNAASGSHTGNATNTTFAISTTAAVEQQRAHSERPVQDATTNAASIGGGGEAKAAAVREEGGGVGGGGGGGGGGVTSPPARKVIGEGASRRAGGIQALMGIKTKPVKK